MAGRGAGSAVCAAVSPGDGNEGRGWGRGEVVPAPYSPEAAPQLCGWDPQRQSGGTCPAHMAAAEGSGAGLSGGGRTGRGENPAPLLFSFL